LLLLPDIVVEFYVPEIRFPKLGQGVEQLLVVLTTDFKSAIKPYGVCHWALLHAPLKLYFSLSSIKE